MKQKIKVRFMTFWSILIFASAYIVSWYVSNSGEDEFSVILTSLGAGITISIRYFLKFYDEGETGISDLLLLIIFPTAFVLGIYLQMSPSTRSFYSDGMYYVAVSIAMLIGVVLALAVFGVYVFFDYLTDFTFPKLSRFFSGRKIRCVKRILSALSD